MMGTRIDDRQAIPALGTDTDEDPFPLMAQTHLQMPRLPELNTRRMVDDLIEKEIITRDPIDVLRLQAEHAEIAYFPDQGKAVFDPVPTQRLWDERGVQLQWMPKFGLGVGAYVNSDSAPLQIMGMQQAGSSQFKSAEALSDPMWVARHAEVAREVMLSKVQNAAL